MEEEGQGPLTEFPLCGCNKSRGPRIPIAPLYRLREVGLTDPRKAAERPSRMVGVEQKYWGKSRGDVCLYVYLYAYICVGLYVSIWVYHFVCKLLLVAYICAYLYTCAYSYGHICSCAHLYVDICV